MLVNHGIAAGVNDHLDILRKFFNALNTVSGAGHFLTSQNCVSPHINRNSGFDRVLTDRQIHGGERSIAFVFTGVCARQTDLS